jgi:hypothetical protein
MKKSILSILALSSLAACQSVPMHKDPHFWERASVSETVYMRGPKALQTLNRDISHCVVELRELERLGQVKDPIRPDRYEDAKKLADLERSKWDTPEYDGVLFAEHTNYHSFEDCMTSKGWRRTKSVPYETAFKAEETYRANHVFYNKEAQEKRDLHNEQNESGLND